MLYLIRKLTNTTHVKIGSFFDNRTHAAIISAIKKTEQKMKTDLCFTETIEKIEKQLNT